MKFFKIENNENLQANLFSFAVHLALFLIMIFSVGWQTKTPILCRGRALGQCSRTKKNKKTQANPKQKINQNQNTKLRNAEAKAKAKAQKEADIRLKKKKAAEAKAKKLKKQKAIKSSQREGIEARKN